MTTILTMLRKKEDEVSTGILNFDINHVIFKFYC